MRAIRIALWPRSSSRHRRSPSHRSTASYARRPTNGQPAGPTATSGFPSKARSREGGSRIGTVGIEVPWPRPRTTRWLPAGRDRLRGRVDLGQPEPEPRWPGQAIVKIPPGNPATAEGIAVTDLTQGTSAMTVGPDGNIWVGPSGQAREVRACGPSTQSTTYLFAVVFARGPSRHPATTRCGSPTRCERPAPERRGQRDPRPPGLHEVGGGPPGFSSPPHRAVRWRRGTRFSTPQRSACLSPGGTPQTIDRRFPPMRFSASAFGAERGVLGGHVAGNRLDRVTTDGQLTSLTGFRTSAARDRAITAGPGNTLWATLDHLGDRRSVELDSKIARITAPATRRRPAARRAVGRASAASPRHQDVHEARISSTRLSKSRFRRGRDS